ncbi:hypothetical protein K466DRAFT_606238 [Polyporus arcularius HHB13444]|uniref:Uncharacterized protein n=1 Tax=Polyporus arcularius HHB13444 TaxID=1314778 RepID=A0A5C3NSE3_9APHY|nr:hypothetical protein K466DRAFT_606238 [Polyporus arcularius HHB13444]
MSSAPSTPSRPPTTNQVPEGLIIPSDGPYYVVFGRDLLKIHENRPARLALGVETPLLPIVITCQRREHAVAAANLNHAVFSTAPPRDAHAIAFLAQQSKINFRTSDIYCIVRGGNAEAPTGIFIGFPWMELDKYVRPNKHAAHWRKRTSFLNAIFYMLSEKPGSNMPFRSPGRPIPPAPSLLEGSNEIQPPTQIFAYVRMTPQPDPDSADEEGSKGESQAESGASDAGRMQAAIETVDDEVFFDAVANLDLEDVRGGTQNIVEALAQVVLPLPSMGDMKPRGFYPVTFGAKADKLLASRGVSEADVWKVLAARVHSPTMEAFSYHMGMVLQWSPLESKLLWEAIRFPSV